MLRAVLVLGGTTYSIRWECVSVKDVDEARRANYNKQCHCIEQQVNGFDHIKHKDCSRV